MGRSLDESISSDSRVQEAHVQSPNDRMIPVSVDVDETSTVKEHTRKHPPKTFKPQAQISKFVTPVQKRIPASSEQLPSLPNNPSEKPRSYSEWSDWKRKQRREKMQENFRASKSKIKKTSVIGGFISKIYTLTSKMYPAPAHMSGQRYLVGELVASANAHRRISETNIEQKSRLVLIGPEPSSSLEQHRFLVDQETKIWHVRIPSNHTKFDIANALREVDSNEKEKKIQLEGKLAIYVTVGSITSYGVALKDNQGNKEFKPLEGKRFSDRNSATNYLLHLKSTDEYQHKDLKIVEGDEPSIKSGILESLVCLFQIAKRKKAAIVIPDYSTLSPNSKLIEDALNYVDFRGPVVSVSCDDQVASCEETAKMQYQFGNTYHPRGILFARTTHSFQLCESPGVKHTDLYSTLGARLVAAISRPDQQSKEQRPVSGKGNIAAYDSDSDDDNAKAAGSGANDDKREANLDELQCCKHNAVFFVAGGGVVGLRHLEQAVLVGMPVVVLEGSGRLCDYLPKLWVRRFATGFDAVKESNRFCHKIGFQETSDGTLGRQLRQVQREKASPVAWDSWA